MMLRYVYDQDLLVADFVARAKIASGHTKRAGFPDRNLRAIGIIDEALPKQRWLTPTTLAVMFQYPFVHCGCQMLITKTMARSTHVLRMLAAMNFSLILHPRAGGRHEDGVVAQLTYEDWLDSKFCKRFGHHITVKADEAAA
jgi:hypothetical protein